MNRIIACLLKLILAVSITGSLSANWLSSESMTAFSNPEIENLMAQDSLPQRLKILEHLLSTSQSDSLIFEESAYALVLTCIQMENDPMLQSWLETWQNNKIPSKAGQLALNYWLTIRNHTELGFMYKLIKMGLKQDQGTEYTPYWEMLRGILLQKKGMTGAAYEALKGQYQFFTAHPLYDFFYSMAISARQSGHDDEAFDCYTRAYSLKPNSELQLIIQTLAQNRQLSENDQQTLFQRTIEPHLERAPDFLLYDLGGNPYQLSHVSESYVLLVFWASWCGPCRQELPIIEQFFKTKPNDLQIWSINLDQDTTKAIRMQYQLGLTFPILMDEQTTQILYQVQSIPRSILIDPKGRIVLKLIGSDKNIQQIVLDRMQLTRPLNTQ